MLEKVRKTIEKYNMAQKGESLLCCLSGGADSTALLLCLHELGFDVTACHVNHMLRGGESDRDEDFCSELCARLGIPIVIRRVDAAAFSRDNGYSLEEGARVLRYGIFDEIGKGLKSATAHTLSDCLETTLFRLARGTGLDGLTGIPPVRDNIIRPLIDCRREEIEGYLRERDQDWVTDSTNLSVDYSRNRIRHIAIPALSQINTSLEKTYEGTLENLREDSALLKRLGNELYESAAAGKGLDCASLLQADPALSGRAIKRFLTESRADCSRETILRIRGICEGGGKLTLGNGLYAVSRRGVLYIEREQPEPEKIEISARLGCEYDFFGKKITLSFADKSAEFENIHKNITYFFADYGKIKGEIVIRSRRGGDRIRFTGKGFTTDLRKLFQSELPREERVKTVILSDGEGPFFAEGFGFAERVRIDDATKTVLICKIS